MRKIFITLFLLFSFACFSQTTMFAKCTRLSQADSLNKAINKLLKDNISDYRATKWCDILKNKYADIYILSLGDRERKEFILTLPLDLIQVDRRDTNFLKLINN